MTARANRAAAMGILLKMLLPVIMVSAFSECAWSCAPARVVSSGWILYRLNRA